MEFIRVCITNDGNVPRGFTVGPKGKEPSGNTSYWFNPESRMIIEKRPDATLAYDYSNIQGDATFRVHFFDDHDERKSFDELIGRKAKDAKQSIVKKVVKKGVKNDRKKRD